MARPPLTAVLVLLLAISCSGGKDEPAATTAAAGVTAELAVLEMAVEVADGGDGKFAPATDGQALEVGDAVRTDDAGLAEVTYHDGSWMRIDSSAQLTIVGLADTQDGQRVETEASGGQVWARVEKLSESGDAFEVSTPVGNAAVRGTAYAIQCATATACDFTVLDGSITLDPSATEATTTTAAAAAPVTIEAGTRVPVDASAGAGEPQQLSKDDVLADEWLTQNLELDEAKGAPPIDLDAFGGGESPGGDLPNGEYEITWTVDSAEDRDLEGISGEQRWLVECEEDGCAVHVRDSVYSEMGSLATRAVLVPGATGYEYTESISNDCGPISFTASLTPGADDTFSGQFTRISTDTDGQCADGSDVNLQRMLYTYTATRVGDLPDGGVPTEDPAPTRQNDPFLVTWRVDDAGNPAYVGETGTDTWRVNCTEDSCDVSDLGGSGPAPLFRIFNGIVVFTVNGAAYAYEDDEDNGCDGVHRVVSLAFDSTDTFAGNAVIGPADLDGECPDGSPKVEQMISYTFTGERAPGAVAPTTVPAVVAGG